MKCGILGLTVLALLFGGVGQAKAEFTITFSQDGNNVEAVGTGTLNLTATDYAGTNYSGTSAEVNPTRAVVILESGPQAYDVQDTLGSGPSSFGTGPNVVASMGTGLPVGIVGSTEDLLVPHGYTSGDYLSSSATWDNTTISALGLMPGTYTWTWGNVSAGTADSFEVIVPSPATAVPEPSALTLLGIGAVSLVGYGWRRRRKSA